MATIQIIVGTVEGNAWKAAQAASAILEKLGHQTQVNEETTPHDLTRDKDELLLVCCSTTGDGEVPRNIYPVYSALNNEVLDLSGRHYGIIALGDSGFPRFAHAGMLIEDALYRSGAKPIGKLLRIDAQVDDRPQLTAAMWAKDWLAG
ncbi:flavodoxin [Aurantivibrio plasticivorans]